MMMLSGIVLCLVPADASAKTLVRILEGEEFNANLTDEPHQEPINPVEYTGRYDYDEYRQGDGHREGMYYGVKLHADEDGPYNPPKKYDIPERYITTALSEGEQARVDAQRRMREARAAAARAAHAAYEARVAAHQAARRERRREADRIRRATPPKLYNRRSIGIVKLKSDMTTTERGNYYVVRRNRRTGTATIYDPIGCADEDNCTLLGSRQNWEWMDEDEREHDADGNATIVGSSSSSDVEEREPKKQKTIPDHLKFPGGPLRGRDGDEHIPKPPAPPAVRR